MSVLRWTYNADTDVNASISVFAHRYHDLQVPLAFSINKHLVTFFIAYVLLDRTTLLNSEYFEFDELTHQLAKQNQLGYG